MNKPNPFRYFRTSREIIPLTMPHVLFHDGNLADVCAVLDKHSTSPSQSVSEVAGWAQVSYERGDTVRGNAAVDLARNLLQGHEAATGEAVAALSLPRAVAASGDIDAAIQMVQEMPEPHHRVNSAVLLVLDLAGGPDADRAQALLREVSVWRESVDPAWASTALIGKAWAWWQCQRNPA